MENYSKLILRFKVVRIPALGSAVAVSAEPVMLVVQQSNRLCARAFKEARFALLPWGSKCCYLLSYLKLEP
jgi:hypothetical protein